MNKLGINLNRTVGNLTNQVFSMSRDLQQHSVRVACYAAILFERAIELGFRNNGGLLPERWLLYIARAVLYHDLGKLTIPSQILNKEKPLDDREWTIMRQHPCNGVSPLNGVSFFTGARGEEPLHVIEHELYSIAKDAILSHHEYWNGSGYPYGLKCEEIPVIARICAIADAYDAITAERIYQPPIPHEQACTLIEAGAGTQFDPGLVDVFSHCRDAFQSCFN